MRLLTIPQFQARYACCRTRIYELIDQGLVVAVKNGRSTRITEESAELWARSLPVVKSKSDPQ